MRSALCLFGKVGFRDGKAKALTGRPVDFMACAESYIKHIIRVNDCDVFIHCWDIEYKDELLNLYSPKQSIFEPQIQQFIPGVHRSKTEFRVDSYTYSIKQVITLKSLYEQENDFVYDWVMLCRFDMLFFVDIPFSELDVTKFYMPICNLTKHRDKTGALHEPSRENLSLNAIRYSDTFSIGTSSDMDKWSTLFDYRPESSKIPDRMMHNHLIRCFGPHFRKHLEFILYRWWDYELYRVKVCGVYS